MFYGSAAAELFLCLIIMPDSVAHGTLSDGSIREILATTSGRLRVDAGFTGTSVDAFGRLRVSNYFTLFDSSHRFSDNGLWNTSTATGGATAFNANQGLVDLSVTTASGSQVLRESKKVFAYQPGKPLLSMNSFVFAPAKTNLRQRVGHFGSENGFYFEQDGTQISFVLRSKVSGSVVNTVVPQSAWNGDDRLDGSGPSKKTLDPSKIQIFWMDLGWLGGGPVRCGFIVEGELIHCHSFFHAGVISSTYTTTACLPIRYEITNTGATSSSSVLKQVCSSVVSEGGYELRGRSMTNGTPVGSPYLMATAGTSYPLIALRLKSSALDGIALPSGGCVIGTGNGLIYRWQALVDTTVTGGSWVSAGTDSCVEYNVTGTAISGGTAASSGYFISSNQSSPETLIDKQDLFALQLERNTFTSTRSVFAITLSCDTNAASAFGSVDWQEVTR